MLAALTERELAAKQRGVAGVAYPMGYETVRLRDTQRGEPFRSSPCQMAARTRSSDSACTDISLQLVIDM